MSKRKPLVIVTRKLPDVVETRMQANCSTPASMPPTGR